MNPEPNNLNVQWDIDRYLLSDPSLDRNAFEQRMMNDLSLAEKVATAVADLQVISSAARTRADAPSTVTPPTSLNVDRSGTYRWASLAAAAVLVIAVSIWQFRSSSNEDQLSLIADNWVAFENLTTAESLELIATEDQSTDDQRAEDQTDAVSNEQSDWLVEAAREFYLARNEGAAG